MSNRFLLEGGPSSNGGDDDGDFIRVSGTEDVGCGRLLDGVEACTSPVLETLSTCMSESLISESLSLLRKENRSLDDMLKCDGPAPQSSEVVDGQEVQH
jgi:hypothetical protein